MNSLPRFNLNAYETLIQALKVNYEFIDILTPEGSGSHSSLLILRHDIDMHLYGIDEIAAIEKENNVISTYYLLISAQYNLLSKQNRQILDQLVKYGHRIGLHYDLELYSTDLEEAERQLEWEVNFLKDLTGTDINTIVMHQPHLGAGDIFKDHERYVHPHGIKFKEYTYISDSCRAWRDDNLLRCFDKQAHPGKLLLNIHPELWLGKEDNRMDFLRNTLARNMHYLDDRFLKNIQDIWEMHPAPRLHNERERFTNRK